MQTFESASERLEAILALLSVGEGTLDETLTLYAEAAELIRYCSEVLNKAEFKIQEIDELIKKEVSDVIV